MRPSASFVNQLQLRNPRFRKSGVKNAAKSTGYSAQVELRHSWILMPTPELRFGMKLMLVSPLFSAIPLALRCQVVAAEQVQVSLVEELVVTCEAGSLLQGQLVQDVRRLLR
jgi:hypothetical protein